MKPLHYLVLNILSLLFTLYINFLGGTGIGLENSVGEISRDYATLITPAAYAFSIWGLIYFLLILFVIFQGYGYFKNSTENSLSPSGIWFFLANISNALWIFAWTGEHLLISVLVILFLLFTLIRLTILLKLEIWDAPIRVIVFVWWPICIYTGWIILATVLNISVWLESIGLLEGTWSHEGWAVSVIVLATLLYSFLIRERNMREAAMVGIWGFIAIAVSQWDGQFMVLLAALIGSFFLFIQICRHGWRNIATSPIMKYKRGEI
ncbi:MAG: hypothetical protein WDZ72_08490 [Cyclobacteriaceae bacterium]